VYIFYDTYFNQDIKSNHKFHLMCKVTLASAVVHNEDALNADGDSHTSACMRESTLCRETCVLVNVVSYAGLILHIYIYTYIYMYI